MTFFKFETAQHILGIVGLICIIMLFKRNNKSLKVFPTVYSIRTVHKIAKILS